MKKEHPSVAISEFATHIQKGLTAYPKYLSSKYIYDKQGDRLFQQIMELPDYYLTSCEFSILRKHTQAIAKSFNGAHGFDLIELGAGDGKKTKILLRHLVKNNTDFEYFPIDISQHILDDLKKSLATELPDLSVNTQQGTYFKALKNLTTYNTRKKVIMVLGSNIGNLLHQNAINFMQQIQEAMQTEDMLFMGFDQKKHPQTIVDAYNDNSGITEKFNKNLLVRINREFDADFNTNQFFHWETYNPETGTAKSFLVSKKAQAININALSEKIFFKKWETIHTEISQKYDDEVVEWIAGKAGLKIERFFTDDLGYYKNYIFRKK